MQKKYIGFSVLVAAIVIGVFSIYANDELSDITQRNEVQLSVTKTIESFNGNLTSVVLTEGEFYSFVLDEKLTIILAHPREELVNTPPTGLDSADISIKEMLDKLEQDGSLWINYEFTNPETGNVDPKTAFLVKEGGYVFGAGYYSP